MGETHTEIIDGWTITVWEARIDFWLYIATKGDLYKHDYVTAVNRNDAVRKAKEQLDSV